MIIKTKVIVYYAEDVITSNIEDLYDVAIDNGDMENFEDWLKYDFIGDIRDVFSQLKEYACEGKSIFDFIESHENKYKEYKKNRMEDLLDYDNIYHSREIEVFVDVAVN